MLNSERNCPRCGLALALGKLDGSCPACLFGDIVDLGDANDGDNPPAFWEDPTLSAATAGRGFSHYDLFDELGRGGMGTVYKARDRVTERIVALKVLQAHHLFEAEVVQRFRSEVRAISSLDHRHILPIHEVGEHDGVPFFSMKLASGGSLAQRLSDYVGQSRRAAQLLAKVARGVQHAHERGILHRDLKPGNILLDEAGEPYVCDFGLAKWIEDDRRLTLTSAVLGTPHYIAPEQAAGKQGLTIAADIYSLGAILYELLTGRPPFTGETAIDTLRQASENTPAKPSSIVNGTPRDIETICLKALQREPGARYATAGAFAEDLERWLSGRPIRARPVGAAEQLWRWARRNPLPAALSTALLLALTVGTTIAAIKIDRARVRAVAAECEAREQLYASLLAQARASRMTSQAGHRIDALAAIQKAAAIRPSMELRNEAIAALTLVDLKIEKKIKVRESSRQPIAFDKSLENVLVGTDNGSINLISTTDGRIQKTFPAGNKPILWLNYDGSRYFMFREDDDVLYLADFDTATVIAKYADYPLPHTIGDRATDCIFSTDTKFLALGSSKGIAIVDISSGQEITRLKTHKAGLLAFDPTDGRLAFGSAQEKMLGIWNFRENASVVTLSLSAEPACMSWSLDGQYLAVGYSNSIIEILETKNWRCVGSLTGHSLLVSQVVFNHRGDQLVSTARDSTIRLWDIRTMRELVELPRHGSNPTIRFSADDRFISATDSQRSAVIIKIVHSSQICTAFAPAMAKEALSSSDATMSYSSDSRLLAKASIKTVQIFDAKKGRLLSSISVDPFSPSTVNFLHDGETLAVLSPKHGLVFYKYVFNNEDLIITDKNQTGMLSNYTFGFHDNRERSLVPVLSASEAKGSVITLPSIETIVEISPPSTMSGLTVSPNNNWMVSTHTDRTAQIWMLPSGGHFAALKGGRSGACAFSPSGRWLACSGSGADHVLWDTNTWSRGPLLPPQVEEKTSSFSFSADEKLFAASLVETVALVSIPKGEFLGALEQHLYPATYNRLKFSPDCSILATQGADNSLCLWNLHELRKQLRELNLDWE